MRSEDRGEGEELPPPHISRALMVSGFVALLVTVLVALLVVGVLEL